MAQIHKRHNANAVLCLWMRIGAALCVLIPLSLTAWTAWAWLRQGAFPLLPGCAAAASVPAGALLNVFFRRRAAILSSGLAGEQRAQALLRGLPREYQVLLNGAFSVHGARMELDAIVIGKNGAFIVEVKNHTGTIRGAPDAPDWTQTTRSGKKRMPNPLNQLEREERLTRQLFASMDISCPVSGGVFFANENARVQVRDPRLYDSEDALLRAVRSLPAPPARVNPARIRAALEEAAL